MAKIQSDKEKDKAKAKALEDKENNARLAQLVKQKGLKGILEDVGISPSTSSKPLASHGVSLLPSQILSQSYYSIKTWTTANYPPDVLLLNGSAYHILEEMSFISACSQNEK